MPRSPYPLICFGALVLRCDCEEGEVGKKNDVGIWDFCKIRNTLFRRIRVFKSYMLQSREK